MHPTLSLAISSEMSAPPPSTLDPSSRLSTLAAHLKDTVSLTPAQQTLLHYHLSALETVLASPPPSSFAPSNHAVSPPSARGAAPSTLTPRRQGGPDGLLDSLTALTSSLRARHAETQNLHALLLLKLSTLGKRVLELEGRIREFGVMACILLHRGFTNICLDMYMADTPEGAHRDSRGEFDSAAGAVARGGPWGEEVDGWGLGVDPFVDGRDAAGGGMERDMKRMRTGGGMGVYGIDATRRVELEARGKGRMVDGGWDVVGDGEDDWERKWGEEEDAAANARVDVETWRRHWEEVERSFSPRRGGGRRLGRGRHENDLDAG